MADIIDITSRLRGSTNLIEARPLEFRKADWKTGHAIMCTRGESARFEAHRAEALRTSGHNHVGSLPNHFTLDGGYHYTAIGLFRFHSDEAMMRRVYRLAALMECVMNGSSSVLRTDLLRRFYQTILSEREDLGIIWRGNIRHFLLPMHPDFHNPNLFLHNISQAPTLKELYDTVQAEANTQFDILCQHYVLYIPENLIALQER